MYCKISNLIGCDKCEVTIGSPDNLEPEVDYGVINDSEYCKKCYKGIK